jgi:hypothetical protein
LISRIGSSPSRHASRGWSRVGARLPRSDTSSVTPVYAGFTQMTSPNPENGRKGRGVVVWSFGADRCLCGRPWRIASRLGNVTTSSDLCWGSLGRPRQQNDLEHIRYAPDLRPVFPVLPGWLMSQYVPGRLHGGVPGNRPPLDATLRDGAAYVESAYTGEAGYTFFMTMTLLPI